MKFNVCLLNHNIHTQCFAEVADSLVHALGVLGHEASLSNTYDMADDVWNVVLGMRPDVPLYLRPENTILYNGEQARAESIWPGLVDLYRKYRVWDYSRDNASNYPKWGLPAPSVVTPGYASVLEGRIEKQEPYEYDVSFVGSMNERRRACLDKMKELGLRVLEVPFGVYGKERDALLGKAPVSVNIHYYSPGIFESVRCSYLTHNGIRVVSEHGTDNEGVVTSGCIFGTYEELPDLVLKVASGDDPSVIANSALEWIKSLNVLEADLSKAIESLKDPMPTADPAYEPQVVDIIDQMTGARPKITLSMIVKNEAAVIQRCLHSVKHLLSGWVIVDTGSTDGTQDLIREVMKDIPGAVHDLPWKEFDVSRTEALTLAREHAGGEGWIMMFDADEFVEMDGVAKLGGYDCYNATVTRCMGCSSWSRPFLMRANKSWYFEMPRHEGLYSRENAPSAPEPLENLLVMSTYDGARATEEEHVRFLRDAKVLEEWHKTHPNNSRCVYYMAQSYKDAAKSKSPIDTAAITQALKYYLKRADMPGHPPETFSAAWQAANCMNDLAFPKWRVMDQLLKAYEFRPSRAEPLYLLAVYHRELGKHACAEIFARKAASLRDPEDNFHDCDFAVYTWKSKDELANALTYLNGHAEAREIYEEILSIATLPPGDRARIQANYEMCLRIAPEP